MESVQQSTKRVRKVGGQDNNMLLNIVLVLLVILQLHSAQGDVIRNTTNGKIKGVTEKVLGRDVNVFLGIPYARPPVGHLRFRRPEPHPKWDKVMEATTRPTSCHQRIDMEFNRFPGVQMWNPNTDRSEDCLYLNVWEPVSSSSSMKAVMVWIYGGAFNSGTSTLDLYDGKILAAEGDVVVVSMQYRLGALGFLYLGIPEAPGNQGMLDQRLALKWVHDNIGHFGGDASRVTVFGESAGACSTSLHLVSPMSRDLVKSGIMQSASATASWCVAKQATAKERAMALSKELGCSEGGGADTVKCLENIDVSKLITAQEKVENELIYFSPTIDNFFLTEFPAETIKSGKLKQRSILLGFNHDEGFYFLAYDDRKHFDFNATSDVTNEDYRSIVKNIVGKQVAKNRFALNSTIFEYGAPYYLKDSASYRKASDDIYGDLLFKCPVVDTAQLYASSSAAVNVYLFEFNHRTSANPWPKWMGVMHGYEIDHVFGCPLNTALGYSADERQLSKSIIRYWTNFAKFGDPNGNSNSSNYTYWPPYKLKDRRILTLETGHISVQNNPRERKCDFWRSVVPDLLSSANSDLREASRRISAFLVFLLLIISYG